MRSSDVIEEEITIIQAQADEIHRKVHKWLIVLTIVFVPFSLFSFASPSPSQGEIEEFVLIPSSIFFFSLAIYFASLLRKPQFAALYINKNGSDFSASVDTPKSKKVSQMTPALIFSLSYLFMITASLFVAVASFIPSVYALPAVSIFFVIVLYLPLFPVAFLLRRYKSTKTGYVVPIFYGLNLSLAWMIVNEIIWVLYRGGTVEPKPLMLSFDSFVFLILVSFLLGHRVLRAAQFHVDEISAPLLQQRSVTDGVAILPRSVRVGQSCNVMIDFDLSKYACDNAATNRGECCRQLEMELQAAGITVDGEKKLQPCTDSPLPVGIWNCYFPSRGHHTVNVLLREVRSPRNVSGSMPDNARGVIFVHKTDINTHGSAQAVLPLAISGFAAIATFYGALQKLPPATPNNSPLNQAATQAAHAIGNATAKVSADIILPSIVLAMHMLANSVHVLLH
ncbi:MAG: hypothetical protein ACXVIP_05605 [Halobacteriota archaeon]